MIGLELSEISKRYGALQALDAVSLSFTPGEVHAVLGENGAGKSTLVNIIAGLTAPDTGTVTINGVQPRRGDAVAARRAGLGVVHQHFTLVPDFSVAENIALFRMSSARGTLNVNKLVAPAVEKANELGWTIDLDVPAGALPVGAQQRIEILKCLCDDEGVLVFDEPTAPLGPDEVADLLAILRRLAESGRIVVLIAHKLKEVLAVADRVSVLRRGKLQAVALQASEVTPDQLAELMVGELPIAPKAHGGAVAEGLLVRKLVVRHDTKSIAVRDVHFDVRRGEIFGIGGVDGNGQVELAEAIAGIRPYTGSVLIDGKAPTAVAYIPADRHSDGLALGMSVAENLMIGRLTNWPKRKEILPWAKRLVSEYDVKTSGPSQGVRELSGGNQQKIVVARNLDPNPDVVVAVNPTRGLDLKASAFVYDQLRDARNRGAAVILVSADLDELYSVADRVCFMSSGTLTEAGSAASLLGGAS